MATKKIKISEVKAKIKQPKKVESSVCEKCQKQCEAYSRYIQKLKDGKVGLGVLCRF